MTYVKSWKSDDELFARARRELFTAVIGDVMDVIGRTRQFLPPRIKPLHGRDILIGRAMTVLEADVFHLSNGCSGEPLMDRAFGLMFEALDDLKPNEIYVAAGASPNYALWGELLSTRAMQLGAAGAIVDGYHRDTNGIIGLEFPVFSYGAYGQDQGARGKVIAWRVPLEIGGVTIQDGDILVGDVDGVCVVPDEIHEEIFCRAFEKANAEKKVSRALQEGMGAQEAWDTFGIM